MSKDMKVGLEINLETAGVPELRRAIDALSETGVSTEALEKRLHKLEGSWDALDASEQANQISLLRDEIDKTASKTTRLDTATTKTAGTFEKMRTAALQLGAAVAGVFAVQKIAGFFSGAVRGAGEFEEQLDKVAAVSGATADEMRKIEQVSKQLGASTRYTAAEAAQGFETLARAGLDARESIEALPSVLALAQGNGIDLAEAASFITQSVAGMNLKISESGHVADVLAKAAASANTDVSGLGQALSYAAPSAASLGVSLEETVAIIGKFADAGIDASRAGTALNSIMSQFANPASKFREELAAAGIKTNDFGDALRQLAEKGKDGEKAIFAVGQEAGPALKALLAQGTPALDELIQKLKNSDGAAQDMAKTMDDNLPGAVRGLGSAWDSLKTKLVQPLLEPIQAQVSKLTESIRQATDGGAIDRFAAGLVSVFQASVTGVNTLVKYSGTIATLAASMVAAKAAVAAKAIALRAYAAAAGTAATATTVLKTAIRGLGSLGLAAGITGAIELYKALKSNVDDVNRAYRQAISTWADARIAQYRLNSALEMGMDTQSEYVQKQQDALRAELDAIDARVAGYEEQKRAALERFFVDHKAIAAANEAIEAEQERRVAIQATVDKTEALVHAQKEAARVEAEAAQAREASASGWNKITAGIDGAEKAMMQIPERSQQIIDGLNDLSRNANETGENLALAFRIGIADVETREALQVMQQQLQALAAEGRITAGQFDALSSTISARMKELPPAITEGAVALQKLGIDAQQMATGISQAAQSTIKNFKAAAKEFGGDTQHMAEIFNAAAKKISSPEEWAALVAALRAAGEKAGLTADQIDRIIDSAGHAASETSAAFAKIGVDIDAVNNGISASNRQMIANFVQGMEQAKEEGVKTSNVVKASFEQMTAKLSSPAEFKALYDALRQTGALSQLTAEQIKFLQAGMQGGAEAAKAEAAALAENTTQKQANASAAGQNAKADRSAADAKKELTEATKENTEAQDKSTESTKSSISGMTIWAANAFRSVQALTKLGYSTKETSVFVDIFREGMKRTALSLSGYISLIEGSKNKTIQLAKSFKDTQKNAELATRALSANTATVDDLRSAQDALRHMTEVSVGALREMGSQTLDNLRNAIDDARQRMVDLKQEAKDTADTLEAELARMHGDDSKTAQLEQERKLRELNAKLHDAELRRNEDEIAQYQRAIQLQQKIGAEKAKQAKQRAEEAKQREQEAKQREAERSKQRESTRSSSSNQTQSRTTSSGGYSMPDGAHVAKELAATIGSELTAREKQIAENAQQMLADELRRQFKGRAY